MPLIPASVVGEPLPGLKRIRQGKVRDTYLLPDNPDLLLVVATDRISIFDFVLNATVLQKGQVLNALNHFWRMQVLDGIFPHDLIGSGSYIDRFLPTELRNNGALQSRASVVQKLNMIPYEAIVRGVLTGSSLKMYAKDRTVCGHLLPPGLQDGDELQFPIFTPTTKEDLGHDVAISANEVARRYPGVERMALQLFVAAREYARSKGIYLADTKVEMGFHPDGTLTLGDEVFTPDSSRFWEQESWFASRNEDTRKAPTSFDKEFVRKWGKTMGLHDEKLFDPINPEHVERAHALALPTYIVERTTQIYRYIFWRLTGKKLERYQSEDMEMSSRSPKVHIEVVSGSASDIGQMHNGLHLLDRAQQLGIAEVRRHVISCHRNPDALADYAASLDSNTIVIAGAGMAAALPGVLKARLVANQNAQVPVIGVAFEGISEADNEAARLSIERLPGRPVLLDPEGNAYFGPDGFELACELALHGEFLPTVSSKAPKPAELDAPLLG